MAPSVAGVPAASAVRMASSLALAGTASAMVSAAVMRMIFSVVMRRSIADAATLSTRTNGWDVGLDSNGYPSRAGSSRNQAATMGSYHE
jgi:hypothetical protein